MPESPFIAALRKRLGPRVFLRPNEVAVACDVSLSTVYEWIQAGAVEASSPAVGRRAAWQILGESVLAQYARNMAGNERRPG